MNKDIKKVELLAINPKVIDAEVKIEIIFSEVAKWVPKELLKLELTVPEWLHFLENCFIQFNNSEHIITSPFLAVEHQKSQINLIGSDKYSFAVPKTKWKCFIEEQAEKLFHLGIIST